MHNSQLAFDPSCPHINHHNFWEYDWTDFHEGAGETIPPNTPLPRHEEVDLCMFVDSNHVGSFWTRSSKTKFMRYMNMPFIDWYSKMQSTIESSVFGAEFVSMKVGVETLHAIQYEFMMMSILIPISSYIHRDNMQVIHNTSKPESSLKKKCNAIAYHAIHESVAMIE